MNLPFVADASVAVSWVVGTQATAETDRLLDAVMAGRGIIVPSLWPFEVANTLLVLLRRKRQPTADYLAGRVLLGRLRASIDDEGIRVAGTQIADLALEHDLTVYDAAYLELAIRKQLPLASRDGALNRAASRCGVGLAL